MFHQILKSRERARQTGENKHSGNTYYTPDDKRQLELMRETEDRQPRNANTHVSVESKQKRRVRLMLTADIFCEAAGCEELTHMKATVRRVCCMRI